MGPLKDHFTKVWQTDFRQWKYSGYNLVEEINEYRRELNNKRILDVGCGHNDLKRFFGDDLTGIDLCITDGPDHVCDILEFEAPHQFGICLCLGSVNFGEIEDVEPRLKKCIDLVVEGGYLIFRANPGIQMSPDVKFFDWRESDIDYFGKKYHLNIVNPIRVDTDKRLVWHWQKGEG